MAYYLNGLNGIVLAVDACNDPTVIGGIVPELYWISVTSYIGFGVLLSRQ
ncbi:hypothetical protein [Sphingobacterium kyonggiense]